MKKLIELILEDLSTKEYFKYRVRCAECGREYGKKEVRFSKAGIKAETENKKIIYSALYEQESNVARKIAVKDAVEHLNYCSICKRLVCNHCFLICDDLDMCIACAERLEETGNPVSWDGIE